MFTDEGALVKGAKKLGFSFNVRTPTSVIINAVSGNNYKEVCLSVSMLLHCKLAKVGSSNDSKNVFKLKFLNSQLGNRLNRLSHISDDVLMHQ